MPVTAPGPRGGLAGRLDELAGGLDPWLRAALAAVLLAWVVLSLACLPMITLGTDEAWVLMGLRCWTEPAREDYSVAAIHTNGGLHAAANVLIERAVGNLVWVHRLFSWACLMAVVALVAVEGRRAGGSTAAGLVALSPLIGLPGLAENGTPALGTPSGILLLVLATWLWGRRRSDGPVVVVSCGLLYGLAAACRLELMLAVPAVVLAGCVSYRPVAGFRLRLPAAELVIAALVAAVLVANYKAHGAVSPPQDLEGHTLAATGLVRPSDVTTLKALVNLIDYPRLLNRVKLAQEFCPLALLVLASLVPFAMASAGDGDERSARLVRPTALLTLIGWALWFGWLLRTPIPHLRYILPALACFAVAGGLGLARLFGWARESGHRLAGAGVLVLAVAQVVGGLGPTFRNVVHGEHDIQSFEWSGWQGLEYFRRFQHVQDQRSAIAYLKQHIPADAPLAAPSQFHILRYLLDRPVASVGPFDSHEWSSRGPSYLILTPPVRAMRGDAWLQEHGRLVAEFGGYSIHEVRVPAPDAAPPGRDARPRRRLTEAASGRRKPRGRMRGRGAR